MKLVRIDKSARVKYENNPIVVGDAFRQALSDGYSESIRLGLVDFENGARNTLHVHDGDQVLIVTEGEGIVATETQEYRVTVGDVVIIPAGEKHWHGAQPGHSMSHFGIMAVSPGQTEFMRGTPPK